MTHLNGRHCLSCTELFVELEVTGEMTFSGWGKQQVQDVVKAMGRGTKVNVHLFSTTLFYTHKAVYIIKRNSWNCKKTHTHTIFSTCAYMYTEIGGKHKWQYLAVWTMLPSPTTVFTIQCFGVYMMCWFKTCSDSIVPVCFVEYCDHVWHLFSITEDLFSISQKRNKNSKIEKSFNSQLSVWFVSL